MTLTPLEEPVQVTLAYPGHGPETFTFTHLDPRTGTYYTNNRAAHISQAALDQIQKGTFQWLRLAYTASEDS